MPTETTIILAIIGMLGLFATATVYQRSNRITQRYYNEKQPCDDEIEEESIYYASNPYTTKGAKWKQ
tara:strand:- start:2 stop:202 length:201 start_codon:yes stop_codon:yes gene_type:complete